MKHKLFYTLGLIVLVMVAFATSPANAQTTANGPYYATPSWDQTLACTTTANCPRFIVLSNMNSAAVLDRETGLVWEKAPSQLALFSPSIHRHCNELAVGNRFGWRLPSVQELASLIDPTVPTNPNPALPAGHPFVGDFTRGVFWTSTSAPSYAADSVYFVEFNSGRVEPAAVSGDHFVWCVRSGSGDYQQ